MGCGSSKSTGVHEDALVGEKDDDAYESEAVEEDLSEFYFPDFPTPALLQKAQREYAVLRGNYKKEDGSSRSPYPTLDRKCDVFQADQYKALDKHAIATPHHLYSQPIDKLVNHITKYCKNQLEIVRSIFSWIASVDINAINLPQNASPDTVNVHLQRINNKQDDHVHLFEALCKTAGIKCHVVEGYVKGAPYEIGSRDLNEENAFGRWTAVEVDHVWRFVDANWGSGHATGVTDDWLLVDDNGRLLDPDKKGGGPTGTKYSCNESWFLTDPETFIFSHFPSGDKKLQLLARTVTKDEFEEMPFLKPPFFELDLAIGSHPKCLLTAPEGEVEITIGYRPKSKARFMYRLYIDGKEDVAGFTSAVAGGNLKNFVIMCQSLTQLSCGIVFPKAGRYKFELYGSSTGDTYAFVGAYVIRCDKGKPGAEATPDNTRTVWGPGADSHELGLVPVTHDNGIIDTDDGQVEIRFKYDVSRPVSFLQELVSDNLDENYLSDFAFHRTEGDEVIFTIRLPKNGMYSFNIFAKTSSTDDFLPNVCNYLIRFYGNDSEVQIPFPPLMNGELGPSSPNDVLKMTLINPTSPYMKAGDDGEIDIEFTTSQPVVFSNHLFLQNDEGLNELESYILTKQTDNNSVFHIKFPKPGIYHLQVYAKPKGNDESLSKAYDSFIYDCFIEVEVPKENCFPYPQLMSTWSEGCVIIEPQNGILPNNRKIPVAIDVPSAKDVAAISSNGWTYLSPDESGRWIGEVETANDGDTLKISARVDDENTYQTMLQYKVVSEEKIESEVAEMKKVQVKAQAQSQTNRKKTKAKEESALVTAKQNLLTAMSKRDLFELKKAIKEVENQRFQNQLKDELNQARNLQVSLQRIEDLRHAILEMDGATMAEIRRYAKPPEVVHKVMTASLLVLGDPEANTRDWRDCQVLCNSLGQNGLYRRVKSFDVEKLHPEIAVRAKQILVSYKLGDVRAVSAGAGTFYTWALGMIEEIESRSKTKKTVPAEGKRQKELLSQKKKTH